MNNKKLISIVIPCYNEEENIQRTYEEVKKVVNSLTNYSHEIIFVDNGSEDRSAELMKELAGKDEKVTALFLSRNFGPEASGLAGMRYARGDAVISVSADLQEPPSLIPGFIKKWEEGYDLVLGQAADLEERRLMAGMRRFFYKLLKRISYIDIPAGVSGFGLYDARVNKEILKMPERNRFHRGLVAYTGFRRFLVPYTKSKRQFGKSSYNLFTYLKHAESGLFAFTNLPLDFLAYAGVFLVMLSVVIMLVYTVATLIYGNPIKGSATIFLGIMFFGGIQVLAISVLGKYIAVIFEETKNRPSYIIKEIVTKNKKHEGDLGKV